MSTSPQPDRETAHLGYSEDALRTIADENPFSSQGPSAPSREEVKQFVVDLVAANNAALFVDFQVLNNRCDQLLERILELELLTGVAEALSVPGEEAEPRST